MNKYYVVFWIKNKPKDSARFKTFDKALRFRNELLEWLQDDVECIYGPKRIKS